MWRNYHGKSRDNSHFSGILDIKISGKFQDFFDKFSSKSSQDYLQNFSQSEFSNFSSQSIFAKSYSQLGFFGDF